MASPTLIEYLQEVVTKLQIRSTQIPDMQINIQQRIAELNDEFTNLGTEKTQIDADIIALLAEIEENK